MTATRSRLMPLKLDVNERCIASGVKANCNRCPIANAIREAVPDVIERSIYVGNVIMSFETVEGEETFRWTARTPETASDFIGTFDRPERGSRIPEPIKFDVAFTLMGEPCF